MHIELKVVVVLFVFDLHSVRLMKKTLNEVMYELKTRFLKAEVEQCVATCSAAVSLIR